eukprot:TRINITY_DN37937_c0_g1_i1.p2 TRINITY_DN37937_c0_g1~~TRINITY_DN37937_c0_g1_i1.p2  ORF type:complete len:340 (-),score=99.50 TRINITY_DN37937_c0_g1_i1:259-1278(-)
MGEQFKWNPSGDKMGVMLRQAVYSSDLVALEHLLKQRADLEMRDENSGSTPLHIAATNCKTDMISWLLKRRADVAAKDGDGFSSLAWSCMKGHKESMTMLLDARAEVTEIVQANGRTPLLLSAERGFLDCVETLLERRAQLEERGRDGATALMCAAHRSETEIVLSLLGKSSLVNTLDVVGWSPLMYALNAPVASRGMGAEGADKKVRVDGVLGKRSAVEVLMLHKADVNVRSADGLSPLIVAAGHDRPTAVKRLLEGRAEVGAITSRGNSALLMACGQDLVEVVRCLIEAAADVNAANAKGDTPLSVSEKLGHKDLVELLKKAGAVPPKSGKKKGKKK